MNLPPKHKQILDEILKSVKTKPNRPPTLIKGELGTGKSWLIHEIVANLKTEVKSNILIPVYIPMQLSAHNLVDIIQTHINLEKSQVISQNKNSTDSTKYRALIILENIDILFNLSTSSGMFSKPKKIGRGSTQYSQLQYANELRRFLIENNSKVSILATTSENTHFIEDPEQPFYEFFNIIELGKLDNLQCIEYFKDSSKDYVPEKEISALINAISTFNPKWMLHITDGKISLINALIDSFLEKVLIKNKKKNGDSVFENLISSYFIKVTPFFTRELDKLGYSERILIDKISLIENSFMGSKVSYKEFNSSLFVQQLCKKNILEKEGTGKRTSYRLSSMAFKAWIRFSKRCKFFEIVEPSKSC
jgi:hypothetical protein